MFRKLLQRLKPAAALTLTAALLAACTPKPAAPTPTQPDPGTDR